MTDNAFCTICQRAISNSYITFITIHSKLKFLNSHFYLRSNGKIYDFEDPRHEDFCYHRNHREDCTKQPWMPLVNPKTKSSMKPQEQWMVPYREGRTWFSCQIEQKHSDGNLSSPFWWQHHIDPPQNWTQLKLGFYLITALKLFLRSTVQEKLTVFHQLTVK